MAAGNDRLNPESWVQAHGDYLFRYALFRLGDPAAAEDLVQETFLAALRSRLDFTGKSSERTWLIGILKHKLIDHLRKVYREKAVIDHASEETEPEGEFTALGLWTAKSGNWTVQPEQVREQKEFWQVLQNCLAKLPAATAQAFAMREIDGFSSEEICKVLNISANNLWVRLHRARSSIRRCLERHWYPKRS
ncbi:MAG: sigma-70 family RNA polymerase sigma factor [Myxococcales bacterium]|nr:sigma-70 family RNA polymerase sigma factor [Myxococcales bacterium]